MTLGAYTLFNFGVSRIPAGQASAFINLIPIFSMVLGIVVLNEEFNMQQYAACVMIFSGIFLSQHKSKKIEEQMAQSIPAGESVADK